MKKDEFEAHPLWSYVRNAVEFLDSTETDAGPAQTEKTQRIREIAAYVLSFLTVDSGFFYAPMLQSASDQWSNVQTNLEQFISNKSPGHIDNALAQAEVTTQIAGTWPVPTAKGGAASKAKAIFDEAAEQATSVIEILRAEISNLRDRAAAREQEHSEALASVEAQRAALENACTRLQSEIAAQSNKITADETRLDTALTTSNETFTKSQTQREADFKEWLANYEESLDQIAGTITEQTRVSMTEAQKTADDMASLYEKVEGLSGKAAGAVLARDYGTYAQREWRTGIVAIIAGFLAFLGGAAFVVKTISSLKPDDNVSWQYTALKFGLTLTIVAAAVVAVRFGSDFLSKAHTAKRTELELKAIGLFLADVADADKVEQAKLAFVDRMFGRAWEDHAKSAGKDEINLSAVERLFDGFSKVIGR
jgi:hypothetical protein